MTHNVRHNEENRVSSYSVLRLRLSGRSLFFATAITSGVTYLVCVLYLTVAPQETTAFFSYVLHVNLSGIIRRVTWGSFIVGFLVWSMGTGLYAAVVARLYNKLPMR